MTHSTDTLVHDLAASRDKLAGDVTALATEAAELVKGAGARNLERAQDVLAQAQAVIRQSARQSTGAARTYVQANPLATLAIAIAAGLVVGALVSRR